MPNPLETAAPATAATGIDRQMVAKAVRKAPDAVLKTLFRALGTADRESTAALVASDDEAAMVAAKILTQAPGAPEEQIGPAAAGAAATPTPMAERIYGRQGRRGGSKISF